MIMEENMENVFIMDHPLIQHKVTLLRDKNTGSKEFRELIQELTELLCYEATRDLPTCEVEVETPIAITHSRVIAGRKLAFVPILRAGIGMVDGAIELVPAARWAISACSVIRKPSNRWNTTARCPAIFTNGTSSFWILCWPPAAPPSTPSTRSGNSILKASNSCVSSPRRRA